jgi:Amt family ammonium transporter
MEHVVLAIVGTVAILAVIPALSVYYREFFAGTRPRASILLTVTISGSSLLLWLLISIFVVRVSGSPLEFPVAALAAVSGFLASLTVRDTTSRFLPATLFSIGWSVLVFSPVAIAVLFPTSVGIPVTMAPLDFGGALPVQVAVGSAALIVLLLTRRTTIDTRSLAHPKLWVLLTWGAVGWICWILGFVGLELMLDDLVTPIIVLNSIVAPVFGMFGWILVQRILTSTTTASGAAAGLLCGLIAITAGSAYLTPLSAGVTGVVAGIAASLFVTSRVNSTARRAWFIVGAHLIAAAAGLFMVGIFGSGLGLIYDGQPTLVEIQLASTAIVVVWSGLVSVLLWLPLRWVANRSRSAG